MHPIQISTPLWLSCLLAFGLVAAGCPTAHRSISPVPLASTEPFEATGLAGEWEVSDGTIDKMLVLDCQGRGRYDWQDGWVSTTSVRGNYWTGTWHQSKNDREGGFEVILSADRSKAEGRWWYTRIGEKRFASEEGGGEFNMTRPLGAVVARDRCRRTTPIHEAHGPH